MACSAILNENEFMNTYTSQQDPYDQYEVSIPMEVVGDCMAKVHGLSHDQQACVQAAPMEPKMFSYHTKL